MTDDSRIAAAARVLHHNVPGYLHMPTCLELAEKMLVAADRAAWRPIEEAPKKGVRREVWIDLRGEHVNDRSYPTYACWDGKLWQHDHGGRPFDPQPTHWKHPLTAPPEPEDSEHD